MCNTKEKEEEEEVLRRHFSLRNCIFNKRKKCLKKAKEKRRKKFSKQSETNAQLKDEKAWKGVRRKKLSLKEKQHAFLFFSF